MRYPSSPLSEFIINTLGGFAMRAMLHRAAAIVLVGLTVYHIFYTALGKEGRAEFRALLPAKKDFLDLLQMLKYYFALAPTGPKFDRYDYIEKFEYFAVGWGSVIMILTGFMLWFPERTLQILPVWALDIARVVHSYEALLAFLTIIIWHMYHVHLKPGRFPMNWSWLTGKIAEDEMRHHHPLEYERLTAGSEKVGARTRETEEEQ